MVKHFENLWEEAELVAKEYFNFSSESYVELEELLINRIKLLQSGNDLSEIMGEILFALCYISENKDINVYSALREVIDNHKIDMLDTEIHV